MSKKKRKPTQENHKKLPDWSSELDELKRQLEIEAALERVRNRTLLMRDSSELNEAVAVFFQQFQTLDLLPTEARTYFCHIDTDTDVAEVWMTHADGTVMKGSHQTPLTQSASMSQYYKAWKEGKPIMVRNYTGAALTEYLKFVSSLPHVKVDKDYQKLFRSPPEQIIMTDANFLQGNIGIMTFEPLTQAAIDTLIRFAKVFEFTYTRFLDLKKAEEQAREAQIEAALERVRAKALAMHKSDELIGAATVMYEEFRKLGLTHFLSCGFALIDEENKLQKVWAAQTDTKLLEHMTLPLLGDQVFEERYNAWKRQDPIIIQILDSSQLEQHLQVAMPDQQLSEREKQSKTDMPEKSHFYMGSFTKGYLLIISSEEMKEEFKDILVRFAKVFEQTYTRFLDLQKAEKQAREAQIEASLERVRTKAMAMHSSEDLTQTIGQLFRELDSLDISLLRCGVGRIHKDTREVELFTFSGTRKGKPVPVVGKAILTGHPVLDGCFQHWEKQQEYHPVLKGASLKKYYQAIKADFKLPGKQDSLVQYGYFFSFPVGVLYTYTETMFTAEELTIFRKFSSVMGLTYRRFLDLKEAEAQAREAQIEVALERVRARTMAMHKGDELADTSLLLFEQITELGIKLRSCGFLIMDEKTESMEDWSANLNEKGKASLVTGTLAFDQHPMISDVVATWRKGEPYFIGEIHGKDLQKYYQAVTSKESTSKAIQDKVLSKNVSEYTNSFYFEYGMMYVLTADAISEHVIDVLLRFAGVFKLTYRRFLDLQNAEAQAWEAQIETGLERVRAATMGMQKSEDLVEVATVLYNQLLNLKIGQVTDCSIVIIDESNSQQVVWASKTDADSLQMSILPLFGDHVLQAIFDAWNNQETFFTIQVGGVELENHLEFVFPKANRTKKEDRALAKMPDPTFFHCASFSEGYLELITSSEINGESSSILSRFAKVFEQTYTRFLDLKKAESQAREAQIEAALERVRSAAMAMHSSEDLFAVAEVLHDQLADLGQKELESSIIHIYPENLPTFDAWYSYRSTDDESRQVMDRASIPWNACSWTRKVRTHYQSKEKAYMIQSRGKMLSEWYQVLEEVAPAVIDYDEKGKILLPDVLCYHFSKFSGGALLMVSNEPPTEEARDMQQRAAMVFDLAYTRFLDLKHAEAQAREAKIEAALERVRSRSMAMQHSSELNIILAKVFEELISLKLELERCVIWIFNPEDKSVRWWAANPEAESGAESFLITNKDHPVYNEYWQAWEERRTKYLYVLEGENMVSWCDVLFNETELRRLPEEVQAGMREPDQVYLYNTFNDFGVLFLACLDRLSDEKFSILERFGKVFDQSYTRFKDIKQAEAREKEAIKQSSLDRVRAEIASMRNTKDLERITPIIWTELTTLGVPFFRCGVFIIDETSQTLHMYLSKPTGESLAALHLDFDDEDILLVKAAVDHWKTQTVHRTHWDRQQFREFTKSLKRKGLIESLKTYQQGEKPPEHLNLHQVPFKQGMLYVGSSEPLPDDQIELIQSLADAFSVAYSRYEDFVQLEEAKESVEHTLSELQSAQNQLIHSEKMASLGELTAGIAHEIQNPLNFVNNFSEVSTELMEEMKEEIETGNLEDALEIGRDLIQNIEKINHHGQRASSIVKGMLQHSRTSTGKKDPTDINVLADEYLRLAYHGFRAKDKSFNANFKTELADDLPKIEVVTQDIGRVLLNLVNNAFQAVKGVESPEVMVKTQMKDGMVEISVRDNGPGVPEDIKEKIFQPFFTTKPTGEGTGLGLSLSYDIVTKGHGGKLKVETQKGKGSEFIVELPVKNPG